MIGITSFQLIDQVSHNGHGHFTVELLDALLAFAPPLRQLVNDLGQLFLERGNHRFGAFLVLLRQLFVVLRRQHFAFFHGRKRHAGRSADQGDLVRLRLPVEFLEGMLVLFLDLFFQFMPAGPVFLALKCRRDGHPQVIHQLLDIAPQTNAHAGRQSQHVRLVRLGKIIDITPVGRNRLTGGPLAEKLLNHVVFAGSRRPQHEQVVAFAPDANAELQGLDGARLPQHFRQIFKFGGRLEIELLGIAARAQRFGFERFDAGHVPPFLFSVRLAP